jgi:hypothetical protein
MEPPWLQEPALELAVMLISSYRAAFSKDLIAGAKPLTNRRLAAQELFATDQAVLAHDDNSDPRLIYANAAALRLWRRRWEDMVGLPSRLTAEPREQRERSVALALAAQQGVMSGYRGTRIDSQGRRFLIEGACLWILLDPLGGKRGQAACFSEWWWL